MNRKSMLNAEDRSRHCADIFNSQFMFFVFVECTIYMLPVSKCVNIIW